MHTVIGHSVIFYFFFFTKHPGLLCVMWHCIAALCGLVVSSYSEDKYGVVQKSLPEIITAVVTLRDVSKAHYHGLSVSFSSDLSSCNIEDVVIVRVMKRLLNKGANFFVTKVSLNVTTIAFHLNRHCSDSLIFVLPKIVLLTAISILILDYAWPFAS